MTQSGNLTLDHALERYELHLARRPVTENTRKAFLGDVRIFERYLQPAGSGDGPPPAGLAITAIRPHHIHAFLAELERSGIAPSPKSIERRLTSLKVFFGWLKDAGYLAVNPAQSVAYRAFQDPLPAYLREPEVQAAVEAARQLAASTRRELRPLTAMSLALDTGIKKGECLALAVEDVLFDEPGGPCLRVRYDKPHLKFKDRKLRVGDACAQAVREHIERYGCRDRLFECTGRNIEYLFNRKIAPAAGLQSLTFEMLRWTCAVRDFTAGGMDGDQMQVKYGLSPIGWSEMQAKLERLARISG